MGENRFLAEGFSTGVYRQPPVNRNVYTYPDAVLLLKHTETEALTKVGIP